MKKLETIATLFKESGVELYYVGGYVRDSIMNRPTSDVDVCIVGANTAAFVQEALERYKNLGIITDLTSVHGEFPIWIVEIEKEKYEFAMARKERKTGQTHQDFLCEVNNVTIEEDLERRDLTINAIAWHILTKTIVDPFDGLWAIKHKIANNVSDAFSEDPLRVYRTARFIATFDLIPSGTLFAMCSQLRDKAHTISNERVGLELMKVFKKAKNPSKFFYFLKDIRWLDKHFKEVYDLIGVPQSWNHHPEGSSLIQCSPYTSCITSSTETSRKYLSFGQLFSGSFTMNTTIESFCGTLTTESIINSSFDSFSGAFDTRPNSSFLSSILSPAVLTESKSFVFSFSSSTFTANKVIRIMFKIPESDMHSIMKSSINDFEIFNRIIQPISIFMMDMFSWQKFPSQMNHHNDAMETCRISNSGIHDIGISSIIIDSTSMSSNGNIICSFDLGFNSITSFTHFKKFMYQYNTFSLDYQKEGDEFLHIFHANLKLGDVFTHTMHCIDVPKDWFYRTVMLCHDLGKATHTTVEGTNWEEYKKGTTYYAAPNQSDWSKCVIKSIGHEEAGVQPTKNLLQRICLTSHKEIRKIALLVELHMIRIMFSHGNEEKIVRKTLRKLMDKDLRYMSLIYVVYCDLKGRPPKNQDLKFGDLLISMHHSLAQRLVRQGEMIPIVTGKKLLELGVPQTKEMRTIIDHALELQDRGTLKKSNWKKVMKGCGYKSLKNITYEEENKETESSEEILQVKKEEKSSNPEDN